MIHLFEAAVFITYSFLAAIITAAGSTLVSNVLSLGGINLIKATGLTSSYFLVNAVIVMYVFKKDIAWREIKNLFPITIIGAFLGALFLVNISPIILLSLMFAFSLYYIYKKVRIVEGEKPKQDSFWKEQFVGLFAGAVTGAALPGGGFLNSYFASKGFTLQQMFATTNFLLILVFAVKVSVMFDAGLLVPTDLIGVGIAFPFLILANIFVRKGLIKVSRSAADKITILAMSLFSLYALVIIIRSFL